MKIKHLITVLFLTISICTLTAFASCPEITVTSMRVEEPVGIRVTAEIDSSFANESVEEYGFIVSRKVFLVGNGLENTDLILGCEIYYDKGISKGYENGEFVDRFVEKNDDKIYFAAYLHGIPAYYYPEVFVVRPYARLHDSSAVYGEPIEVSLYDEAKDVKANTGLYDETLTTSQKAVVDGVIIAVEGEPYTLDRKDFRIVISSEVIKNANPTYSVCYDLFNPYTGEILRDVPGRKKSRSYTEIEDMLLEGGYVVPMSGGIVQDTTDGYIASYISDGNLTLIGGIDTDTMTLSHSVYDATLRCRDCIKKSVGENVIGTCTVYSDTPVTVVNMADNSVAISDIQSIMDKDTDLLCYFEGEGGVSYADFVKAYVSCSPEGECEYIIAVVGPDENGAADEPCINHTYFDVGFYADGELFENQRVVYGGVPVLTATPSKAGYTFIGWSTIENGEIINPESLPVTHNTEYYAVFEINTYNVCFYVDGELYEELSADYNTVPSLPAEPQKEGCDFIGWSTLENGEAVNPESLPVTKDTEYFAVFRIKTYPVQFYVDGELYKTVVTDHNSFPTLPAEPQKEGYDFIGWSNLENGEVVNPESLPVTQSTEYFAVFRIKTYSVYFYADGELYETVTADYNTCPVLPASPQKKGYIFMGWAASEGMQAVSPDEIPVTDETSYYALFEREIVYYDVVFYFNGQALETASVLSGEKAIAPEEVPEPGEYKRFVGWSLKDSGAPGDVVEVSEYLIYENTQFYSVIETNPNSPEFLEKVQRGYRQLRKLKTSKALQKKALDVIKECVGYIVQDALNFIYIDKNYAYTNYTEMVNTVRNVVKVQMTYDERSAFVSFLTDPKKVDKDVQDFIIDYFDINTNIS